MHIKDEGLFKVLLDNLHEGVYFVDPERKIQYWNKGAERISGFSAEEVAGRSCGDGILVHVDDAGTTLCGEGCPLAASISDGKQRETRIYLRHKEGYRVPVQVAVSPIRDSEQRIIGGIETFYDASSVVAALDEVKRLEERSLVCPLTCVGNRQYTEQILTQRLDETKRMGTQLAVLFLDIDHFKRFNDTYGHAVGDIVLKMVARTLSGAMRSYDFIGRWGGEEFVVVLPNIEPLEIEMVAKRLCTLVENSSRKVSKNKLSVTVSIGAYLCKDEDSIETIIANADRLMYVSKKNGRNQVTTG